MYFFLFSINVQQCGYKNCKTQFLILPPSLLFLLFKLLLLCQPIFNDLSSGMLGLMETSSLAKVRFCLSSTFLEVELVTLLALFLKGFLKIDFLFFLGVFNWIFSLSRFEWMALSLPISVWNICREFWASLKSDFSWLLVFLVDSWSDYGEEDDTFMCDRRLGVYSGIDKDSTCKQSLTAQNAPAFQTDHQSTFLSQYLVVLSSSL